MAHEILSIKLCELEDQTARTISRIRLSETIDQAQLRQEIKALKQEFVENELTLQKRLQLSRAEMVSIIAQTYAEVERALQEGRDALQAQMAGKLNPDAEAEERILLAEYALDFAAQATNRALLLSLEAIDAQQTQQEEERKRS